MNGSSNHLISEMITRWRDRNLSPQELLQVDRHLLECEACRQRLAEAEGATARFQSLRAGLRSEAAGRIEHPDPDQLRAYLDGELDDVDREVVGSHLQQCKTCEAELESVWGFRARMAAYPVKEHTPAGRWSFLQWLLGGVGSARGGRIALVGAVGAVVLIALVIHPLLTPGAATVVLNDAGGQVRLDASGRLSGLSGLSPSLQEMLTVALRTGRAPTPAVLAQLRPPMGAVRGADAFMVHAPAGSVVETGQPEFTWRLPAQAVGCKVVLTGIDGKKRLETKMLTQAHWKPKRPLAPGQIYQWQVVALDSNGKEIASTPARPDVARFKVLEADQAARVAQARQTLGNSHLALGILYADEGMLDDATRELQALRLANPASSTAKSLEESVTALRG